MFKNTLNSKNVYKKSKNDFYKIDVNHLNCETFELII